MSTVFLAKEANYPYSVHNAPIKPTLGDIMRIFDTERACVQWLYKHKIISKIKCAKCDIICDICPANNREKKMAKNKKIEYVQRCPKNSRHVFSLTKRSFLENNKHIGLFEFILIVYCYYAKTPVGTIAIYTGYDEKTINKVISGVIRPKIAEYVHQWYKTFKFTPNPKDPTQIDETSLAKKQKHHQGRVNRENRMNRYYVVLCQNGVVVAQPVMIRSKDTLESVVLRYNNVDCVLNVDGFKSYEGLPDYGFCVWTTEHKKTYVNRRNPKANTERAEGMNGALKSHLAKYRGFKTDAHLDKAVQEFVFFFNFKNVEQGIWTTIWDALGL